MLVSVSVQANILPSIFYSYLKFLDITENCQTVKTLKTEETKGLQFHHSQLSILLSERVDLWVLCKNFVMKNIKTLRKTYS